MSRWLLSRFLPGPHVTTNTVLDMWKVGPLAELAEGRSARYQQLAQLNEWRPSKGRACPSRLIGRHCRAWYTGLDSNVSPCLCAQMNTELPYFGRVNNHGHMWLDRDGHLVL